MKTVSVRTARDHFTELLSRVVREHDRVTVTRNGEPVAVLLSIDDLESLEETLAILSEPEARQRIEQAETEVARGEYVTAEELRKDMELRRARGD